MRSSLDFSSWSSLLSTLLGLLLVTCLMMGIRLIFMQTVQKRRERENRQINERLKTLIAAYKTLGGSFTGSLQANPLHLRELRAGGTPPAAGNQAGERQRRIRDAVEAALSDVILLGTEEQVRMAAQAAQEMVAGRSVETAPLVASLRAFIREALDLEPIAADVCIPSQGPARPGANGSAGRRNAADGAGKGGGGGSGTGGMGGGLGGMGGMGGLGTGLRHGDDAATPR
jgi:hypothetical protein